MTDGDLSPTFETWGDRVTYLAANAQLLVIVGLVALGIGIWYFNVSLPGIPGWMTNFVIGFLVLFPPSFYFGIRVAKWLRTRNWVDVYQINYVGRVVDHWYVPPETWAEKDVEGPSPHRVNDGDAVVVREYEYAPEYGENGKLTVSGVELSAMEDGKLFTSKKHAERLYGELVDSHLSLIYIRDSIDDLASQLQERILNRVAEARENGTHLDPDAVEEITESFKERAERITEDQITDLRPEDVQEWGEMPALPAGETTNPYADVGADHTQQAAPDGGQEAE